MNKSKTEYPYTGKDNFDQVVLFTDRDKGVVIESDSAINKVGVLYDSWLEAMFKDITEECLADKKIKILSPLHSEYVQKLAFKYGYGWDRGLQKEVEYPDSPYLYFYDDKDICHSDCHTSFNKDEFQEIKIPLPEDYISGNSISFIEKEDNEEEDIIDVKVGDNVIANHGSGQVLKGKLLAITKEYAIIQQEGHEQHMHLSAWTLKQRTEEELLLESLEFDIQSSKDNCDTALGTAVKLMENYSITKKPQ